VINVHSPKCTARVFQLYAFPLDWDKDLRSQLVWETKLPHGAMLVVTAKANNNYLHCVPLIGKKDKGDKASGAITISKARAAAISTKGQNATGEPFTPPDCVYAPTFLSTPEADDVLTWCKAQPIKEVVLLRTLALKRAPKFVHVVQYVRNNAAQAPFRRETSADELGRWYAREEVQWDTRRSGTWAMETLDPFV
jgi:hypothetical protein